MGFTIEAKGAYEATIAAISALAGIELNGNYYAQALHSL